MNPYTKIALTVIRLVAAGCMLVSFMNLGLYWVKSRNAGVSMEVGRCLLLSIPLVIGLLLLIKSSALARRLTQYFDE